MNYEHKPVLLSEAIEALNIKPDGIYVDATLGLGGHSGEIAKRLTSGRLICFDRDSQTISEAMLRLKEFHKVITFINSDFRNMETELNKAEVSLADGILFDLGVSSPQLDNAARGFSYRQDAPLDMRMDQNAPLTAYEIVNLWPVSEIKKILFEYGQERYAPLIAAAIDRHRKVKPIETTLELVNVIRGAMPAKALREKQHPAKRSFQAIRIAVNDELGALKQALESAVRILKPGGRLAVITFHSLEDKIVKDTFAVYIKGCVCPPEFPVCVCGRKPEIVSVNRKPIIAAQQEIEENPRARSAKLRAAEKL